jgi:hypothetical protein
MSILQLMLDDDTTSINNQTSSTSATLNAPDEDIVDIIGGANPALN